MDTLSVPNPDTAFVNIDLEDEICALCHLTTNDELLSMCEVCAKPTPRKGSKKGLDKVIRSRHLNIKAHRVCFEKDHNVLKRTAPAPSTLNPFSKSRSLPNSPRVIIEQSRKPAVKTGTEVKSPTLALRSLFPSASFHGRLSPTTISPTALLDLGTSLNLQRSPSIPRREQLSIRRGSRSVPTSPCTPSKSKLSREPVYKKRKSLLPEDFPVSIWKSRKYSEIDAEAARQVANKSDIGKLPEMRLRLSDEEILWHVIEKIKAEKRTNGLPDRSQSASVTRTRSAAENHSRMSNRKPKRMTSDPGARPPRMPIRRHREADFDASIDADRFLYSLLEKLEGKQNVESADSEGHAKARQCNLDETKQQRQAEIKQQRRVETKQQGVDILDWMAKMYLDNRPKRPVLREYEVPRSIITTGSDMPNQGSPESVEDKATKGWPGRHLPGVTDSCDSDVTASCDSDVTASCDYDVGGRQENAKTNNETPSDNEGLSSRRLPEHESTRGTPPRIASEEGDDLTSRPGDAISDGSQKMSSLVSGDSPIPKQSDVPGECLIKTGSMTSKENQLQQFDAIAKPSESPSASQLVHPTSGIRLLEPSSMGENLVDLDASQEIRITGQENDQCEDEEGGNEISIKSSINPEKYHSFSVENKQDHIEGGNSNYDNQLSCECPEEVKSLNENPKCASDKDEWAKSGERKLPWKISEEVLAIMSDKLNKLDIHVLQEVLAQIQMKTQDVSGTLVDLLQVRYELREEVDMRRIAIEQLMRMQATQTPSY